MDIRHIAIVAMVAMAAMVWQDAAGASAPLPFNQKSVIYFGWDTLGATTSDVYRNREQFAETGFDGICMPLTGKTEKGADFMGRLPIIGKRFTREQFADSIAKIKEMTKLKGLSGSYLMVYWMSSPRLKWDDNAAWSVFADNMRFLAEVAKETGLKGLFIDHEDYTGKPLFTWRQDDDPPYDKTLELARRRGREIIAATAAGFPDGRIINDRLLMQNDDCARSQQPLETLRMRKDLWSAFVNGIIEAKPDGFGFDDGCEHGYGAMTEKDYLAAKYRSMLQGLPFLDPSLRTKFVTSTKVHFGKWLDRWFQKRNLPFVPGMFAESFWSCGVCCDGVYWVYGEKSSVVKWGRKVHPRVDCETTWNERIPDLAMMLRASVGDYSPLRENVAAGRIRNLIANPSCDSPNGQLPAPYTTYVEEKNRIDGMFSWDGGTGCASPGSLKLAGHGCYKVEAGGLKPYDRIYVKFAAKGDNPNGDVVWRTKGAYEWYLDYQYLIRPVRIDANGWKHYEAVLSVPMKKKTSALEVNQIDSVGIILGGSAGPESPVWFDDIAIFKW